MSMCSITPWLRAESGRTAHFSPYNFKAYAFALDYAFVTFDNYRRAPLSRGAFCRAILNSMKRAILAVSLLLVVAAAAAWLYVQTAPLSAMYRGGAGPPNIVLLHGYGSNAGDWLQFVKTIQLPPNARLVFPNGPWRGPDEARGWWWLNIERYVPSGERLPDFSVANPGGIKVASRPRSHIPRGCAGADRARRVFARRDVERRDRLSIRSSRWRGWC